MYSEVKGALYRLYPIFFVVRSAGGGCTDLKAASEQRHSHWGLGAHQTKASSRVKQQNSHQGRKGAQEFSALRKEILGRALRSGRCTIYTACYWTASWVTGLQSSAEKDSPALHNLGRQNTLRRTSSRGAIVRGTTTVFELRGGSGDDEFPRTSAWSNGWSFTVPVGSHNVSQCGQNLTA
jgi:hypothetical protein